MKVLVVDDHALIRDALARVLTGLVPDVAVREAATPAAAFEVIDREPDLDLVLLDLALPGMHGLTALQTLRRRHPSVSVVVVSASAERDTVQRALDDGALGFIPKSSSNEVLKNALALVLAGGVYLPPELIGRAAAPVESAAAGRRSPADIGLTERQAQILALMMKGESNKMICRELRLAESTVKNQVTAILKALNVTSRTQAVLAVARLGLALPAL
ncbi:MAG TPA: response regulator transcription factor [Burkholderiaceae bacterium]|nr:response regulator transcription factor [Burkholderiaceae bacterium]